MRLPSAPPSAYSAGTLLCGEGAVLATLFAFVACVNLMQSDDVRGSRLIPRVCPSEHCERFFDLAHAFRPMTVHLRSIPDSANARNRHGLSVQTRSDHERNQTDKVRAVEGVAGLGETLGLAGRSAYRNGGRPCPSATVS